MLRGKLRDVLRDHLHDQVLRSPWCVAPLELKKLDSLHHFLLRSRPGHRVVVSFGEGHATVNRSCRSHWRSRRSLRRLAARACSPEHIPSIVGSNRGARDQIKLFFEESLKKKTERSDLGVHFDGVIGWMGVMDYTVLERMGETMNH